MSNPFRDPKEPAKRCVNIDWLEVSAEESNHHFPMNAEYFREQGYWVEERDYGTRVWSEMFTINDDNGHPWIEVRRNPPSGKSTFTGLTEFSCRLRLVNAQCYVKDCVSRLRDFMAKHDYIFKKIYRIDVCYDFEKFDSGDKPAKFARRLMERKYRKVNQCKIHAIGDDSWTAFNWETISWGHPTSMVSTKLYNKSREIATVSKEKVYIKYAWYLCGLVDNPVTFMKVKEDGSEYSPEIWRVEFSMKAKSNNWIIIEDQSGKKPHKKRIPHSLSLFDTPDKLWQRFQDLAFHYFRFKIARYKQDKKGAAYIALNKVHIDSDRQEVRKDLCEEKKLFDWDQNKTFMQLDMAIRAAKPDNDLEILIRRLRSYQVTHADPKLRQAAQAIIEALQHEDLRRYTPRQLFVETEALQRALALHLRFPEVDVQEKFEEIKLLLYNDEIF